MFFQYKNKAIYKTRNTGTGNGMRGMWGTRGLLFVIIISYYLIIYFFISNLFNVDK